MNTTRRPSGPATVGTVLGALIGGLYLASATPFGPYLAFDLAFAASWVGFGLTAGVVLGRTVGDSGGQALGPPDVVFVADVRPGGGEKPKRAPSPAFLGTLVGVFGAVVFMPVLPLDGEWLVAAVLAGAALGMAAGTVLDLRRRALAARPDRYLSPPRSPGGFSGATLFGSFIGTLGAALSPALAGAGLLAQVLAGAAAGMAAGLVWKAASQVVRSRSSSPRGDGPARGGRSPAA